MTTDKVQTVKFYFGWSNFRPDQRAYRQNAIELFPFIKRIVEAIKGEADEETHTLPLIEIEVPLEGKYIANCEAILAEPLNGNPAPEPILRPAGVRFIVDQFDHIFYDTEAPEDTTSKNDDWGDAIKSGDGLAKAEVKTDDWSDDWGNVPAPTPVAVENDEWAESTGNKDDKWDETEEKWE